MSYILNCSIYSLLCIVLKLIFFKKGLYSRRTADQMIKDGRVRVNFNTPVNLGTKVNSKDKIFIDDLLLNSNMRIERPRIWMVYKESTSINN